MGEQLTYHGFWPAPMRVLAELSEWMNWARPVLYCLLAVAVVGLALTLLDMALLLLCELRTKNEKKATTENKTVFGVTTEAEATPTKPGLYAIKALFVLMSITQASQPIFAQDLTVSLNAAIKQRQSQSIVTLKSLVKRTSCCDYDIRF